MLGGSTDGSEPSKRGASVSLDLAVTGEDEIVIAVLVVVAETEGGGGG